jgi:hypothetical protein
MEVAATFDLTQLPLILAGPILRRTESQSVSVWIALQVAAEIHLQVLPAQGDIVDSSQPLLQGNASTIALGKSLHIALVTAQPRSNQRLSPGSLYAYDLKIHPHQNSSDAAPLALQDALRSVALPDVCLSYFAHGLPTFALPPEDLNDLRILHGSCRKLHDHALDTLPIVDQMIAEAADRPNIRPHQLFFTGDQIYGDEVADAFLWAIQQLRSALFGWKEALTQTPAPKSQLKPGKRQAIAKSDAGLTAGLQGDDQKTQSHLLRFSEYCTSYLFAWSECFWQYRLPSAAEMGRSGKAAKLWDQQVQYLKDKERSQIAVRRALANIPTYMIFDDHDISDDWNLNQAWCLRVLGKPLGRQVVGNALLSYTLFQGWGNTPEQFCPPGIGFQLLAATESWCQSQGTDASSLAKIQAAIGMPLIDPVTDLPQFQAEEDVWVLSRSSLSLSWHYRVQGIAHEVLVLDTRTQRGYPRDQATDAPPHLLSPKAFKQQLRSMLKAKDLDDQSAPKITFIVSPTNVFSLEILDLVQRLGLKYNKTYDMDIGDSWNLGAAARSRLMQEIFSQRQRVIVLSGDIHFGAALRVDYWHQPLETDMAFTRSSSRPDACLVQLVASAVCNSELLTEVLQTKLKLPLSERIRHWVGYSDQAEEIEITPSLGKSIAQWLNPQKTQPARHISWGYRSQWLHRQPARRPPWQQNPNWLQPLLLHPRHPNLLQRLWHWRWLQEGREVVGLNNIGLVQLRWPQAVTCQQLVPDTPVQLEEIPIVIYDLYWYAPWQFPHIVYSRFQTLLHPG